MPDAYCFTYSYVQFKGICYGESFEHFGRNIHEIGTFHHIIIDKIRLICL